MHLIHVLRNNIMKKYSFKKVNNDDIKYFSIQLGLLPGYDKKQKSYNMETVLGVYEKWIKTRIENNKVIFAAKITPINFVYGFKNKKHTICNSENAVEIQGEVIRDYCEDIFDNNEQLLKIILELASLLGNELNQERVHMVFNNQKYILE